MIFRSYSRFYNRLGMKKEKKKVFLKRIYNFFKSRISNDILEAVSSSTSSSSSYMYLAAGSDSRIKSSIGADLNL